MFSWLDRNPIISSLLAPAFFVIALLWGNTVGRLFRNRLNREWNFPPKNFDDGKNPRP